MGRVIQTYSSPNLFSYYMHKMPFFRHDMKLELTAYVLKTPTPTQTAITENLHYAKQ